MKQYGLMLAFSVCYFAAIIPYWMIPYNEVNLPHALISPGLFVLSLAALLLRFCNTAPFWKITGFIAASVPCAVITRILFEVIQDPTSHNLWPFEVIIAIFVGLIYTLPGSLVGLLLAKLFKAQGDVRVS